MEALAFPEGICYIQCKQRRLIISGTSVTGGLCLLEIKLLGFITFVNTHDGPRNTSSSQITPVYTETLFWIFTLFRSNFPESDGWFNFNVFLGDVYLFSAVKDKREKRWFSPDRVTTITHTYLLYYSEESKFVLRKLQNSELGDRDS